MSCCTVQWWDSWWNICWWGRGHYGVINRCSSETEIRKQKTEGEKNVFGLQWNQENITECNKITIPECMKRIGQVLHFPRIHLHECHRGYIGTCIVQAQTLLVDAGLKHGAHAGGHHRGLVEELTGLQKRPEFIGEFFSWGNGDWEGMNWSGQGFLRPPNLQKAGNKRSTFWR